MTAHAAASRETIERVAREAYGRLVAFLATRWRDVAAAEDALAEAFAAALERWPVDGVPGNPEGWLVTAARRRLLDAARHDRVRGRQDVVAALVERAEAAPADVRIPDDRLRLMLVCAHPAIEAAIRPALILQVALGLEAKAMASAFLVSPEALTKRLVRAKAKLKAAGVRFEEPELADLGPRLHALLEAVYAAYFLGREGALVAGDVRDQLGSEAVHLAGVIAASLPESPEALGFLALVAFCEARRGAQVDEAGELVPLLEQDPRRWDPEAMRRGYELLARAAAGGQVGPFQLEAAIHGAHCYRARSGAVPWAEIAALYEALVAAHPTVGAAVGLAVAAAHADGGPERGLAVLERLDPADVREYQPFWVARWHLAGRAGRAAEARRCLERALALTTHPRLRRFLERKLAAEP